ncbi:hypothetical protein CYR32_12595 [Chimaeribacter coloradensis]|uniref:Uncharacterized protein n=1 Tax=Chimaeribacter coloradensis TaxID=2060068 RepID=A0A2N5E178_9GAMM|nr:hypothetical protein CYR32_12595 [Chimaeribacter coloradensis]
MFYFRANQVKLTSNGSTRSLFNWRKDLSDVKLISFITTSQSILPDIDTWLDSNDPAQKTALLARAVQSVSSSQILTTVENVKDNARLTFGTTGYNLFQSDKIPEDISWCLMAVKSNKDTRELGSVFSSIANHEEFNNFATSLGSLVATAANPAFRAGVEITKFVTEVMSQRLRDEDDEQLGLLYLSLNRAQHYPHGERKEDAVTDLTGNMLVDYSIFAVEGAPSQQSTVDASQGEGSEPAPKELAKQTIEASLAAAAAVAQQSLAERASAAATVPDQPADVLAKRAKVFLQERESGLLDQARQVMAGIAGAAVSAAGDAAGQAVNNLTTQLGAAALKAINGNAPPVSGSAATLPTGGSGTEPQDGTTSGDPGASGAPGAPIAAVTTKEVVEAGAAPIGDVVPAGAQPPSDAPPSGYEMVGETPPQAVPPAGQAPSADAAAQQPAEQQPAEQQPAAAAQPAAEQQPAEQQPAAQPADAGSDAAAQPAEGGAAPESAPAAQPAAAQAPVAEGSSAIPDQPADVLTAGTGTDNAATQPTGGSGTEPQDGTTSGDSGGAIVSSAPTSGGQQAATEAAASASPVKGVQTAGEDGPVEAGEQSPDAVASGKEILAETPPEAVPAAGQDQPTAPEQPAAAPEQPAAEAGSAAPAQPDAQEAAPAGVIVQSEDGSDPSAGAAVSGGSAQPAAAPAAAESAAQATAETAPPASAESADPTDSGTQEIVVGQQPDAAGAAAPSGGQPADAGQAVDPGSAASPEDAQKTEK